MALGTEFGDIKADEIRPLNASFTRFAGAFALGKEVLNSVALAGSALSGAYTGASTDAMVLRLDPNGANRDVTLVTPTVALLGKMHIVTHTGSANNLVVKDGATTLRTLTAGLSCWVLCVLIGTTPTWVLVA